MKRSLLIGSVFLLLLASGQVSRAQQSPQYSQYLMNYFAINPAMAGYKDCVDARVGYRRQWMGFDGGPRTGFANINWAFSNRMKHLRTKHAAGVSIYRDEIGPTSWTKIQLAYAYHFPVSHKVHMSFGLFGGILQHKFDTGQLRYGFQADPAITQPNTVLVYPDLSAGWRMVAEKTFLGLSVDHLVGNDIPDYGSSATKLERQYYLLAGRNIESDVYNVTYIPSAMIKFAPNAMPALDLSMLWQFEENFTIGGSYRAGDAFVGMVQFSLFKYLKLGYAFDFTHTNMRKASANTHEIILGIYSCPSTDNRTACPAFD